MTQVSIESSLLADCRVVASALLEESGLRRVVNLESPSVVVAVVLEKTLAILREVAARKQKE